MSAQKFHTEGDRSVFAAFSMSFSFLSLAFWNPLTPALLTDLGKSEILMEWPVRPQNPDTRSGIGLLLGFLTGDPAENSDEMDEDFTRLFTGLGSALAPPYESIYLGREKILFESPALDVRNIYRKFHLRMQSLNKIPDDHISCELAFLSDLCGRINEASLNDSIELADTLRSFLEAHILLWSDMFINRVIEHARSHFFQGAARLLRGTLHAFSSFIEESVHTGRL